MIAAEGEVPADVRRSIRGDGPARGDVNPAPARAVIGLGVAGRRVADHLRRRERRRTPARTIDVTHDGDATAEARATGGPAASASPECDVADHIATADRQRGRVGETE